MADSAERANKNFQKSLFCMEFLSSSSSDDDEDFISVLHAYGQEVPKIKNFIQDVVHKFSDKEFQSHFRLSRDTADGLIGKFQDSPFFPKDQTHGGKQPIDSQTHILAFLWFSGNKSSLRDVAQRFNVALSSLEQIRGRVIGFLCDVAPFIIKMPATPEEKYFIATEFEKICGFPNIIGCIDGTSLHIRTPAHKIKSTYVNRHDIPALTLQGICDHNRKFIDVFTGIPGKVHDSRVFKLSDISKQLPEICGDKYHLLGDNAYPLRKYLLTPYKDYGNLTNTQKTYNTKLSTCRVRIENCFGILKARFRQLHQIDMHSVVKMTKFIISCCVLHNICIDKGDIIDLEVDLNPQPTDYDAADADNETELKKQGERKRNAIKNYLEHL